MIIEGLVIIWMVILLSFTIYKVLNKTSVASKEKIFFVVDYFYSGHLN